jgi:hypothetical protein
MTAEPNFFEAPRSSFAAGPEPPPALGRTIAEYGPSPGRIGCAWAVCGLLILLGVLFLGSIVAMFSSGRADERAGEAAGNLGLLGLILIGVGIGVAFWSLGFRSVRVTVAEHGLHIRKGRSGRSILWADLKEIDPRPAKSDGPVRLFPREGPPFLVPTAFLANKKDLPGQILASAKFERPDLPVR